LDKTPAGGFPTDGYSTINCSEDAEYSGVFQFSQLYDLRKLGSTPNMSDPRSS